ncbi:hypothetical protein TIFTF001_000809 [Ficus carica]|uniref:Uncharacterized protein n=1 Tax=Ficus carica TaxID=3494 RepID=A0AA87YX91_FICCA|nr:hypothetical protein TIFTF001_000809 [Ficus carica]
MRVYQLIPFGIFQRLFEFIVETLAAQASKTVTLGQPESCKYGAAARASSAATPQKPKSKSRV